MSICNAVTARSMIRCVRGLLAAVAMAMAAPVADAAIFTYQGVLTSAGSPINGTVDLKFRLYPSTVPLTPPIGSLAINGVAVADGLFKVDLDFGPSAFNGTDRWLEIDVASPAGGGVGPFTTLTPRQQIGYAPMAQYALNATLSGTYANAVSFTSASNAFTGSGAGLTNLNPAGISSGTISNALTLNSAGNAFSGSGAGLTSLSATNIASGTLSAARLPVPLTLAGTNSTHIIRGENTATSGGAAGIFGFTSAATGATYGVFGQSASTTGRGVFGYATSATGVNYGGQFLSDSMNGRGVHGWAANPSGTTYGVYGESASDDGNGVYGYATANSGTTTGGSFRSESTSGTGVVSYAVATSGPTTGVYGAIWSTTGRGVLGRANASSGVNYGGRFESDSTSGFDVYAGGAGLDYGSSSSRRWKSNIRNIDQPLDKIARLRGVYYDWDAEHGGHGDVGFIAEEMGEVLPEIVRYEENGVDAIGIDYSKVTPLLVEALNALRTEKDSQIAALQDAVAQRDVEIDALNARLAAIERLVQQLADDRR